jgi:hypothetical protein
VCWLEVQVEEVRPWLEALKQYESTFHARAHGRSDGGDTPLVWSELKKKQLQELVEQRAQEEQPWLRMSEVDTCKCNQVEDKAHKQQAEVK